MNKPTEVEGASPGGIVKVWGAFVRVFHWSVAVGFFIAYFTEDDAMLLHVWAGYVVGALVVMRALRGLSGPSTPGSAISSILPSPDGSTWPPSSPSGASDTSVTPPAAVV
jgi:hypothetical protein